MLYFGIIFLVSLAGIFFLVINNIRRLPKNTQLPEGTGDLFSYFSLRGLLYTLYNPATGFWQKHTKPRLLLSFEKLIRRFRLWTLKIERHLFDLTTTLRHKSNQLDGRVIEVPKNGIPSKLLQDKVE